MTSPVAEMVIGLIEDGTLDKDLDLVRRATVARDMVLNPPKTVPVATGTGRMGPVTGTNLNQMFPPLKYKRGDRVEIVRFSPLKGVTGTVRTTSTGNHRWIVLVDVAHLKKAEPYLMKRYPNCISIPEICMEAK